MSGLYFADLGTAHLMPYKAHATDAGYDLYVSEDVLIEPGEFKDVPSGVACQLPENTWGMLTGRSSALRKHGLLVNQGIIDNGYRGELYAGAWNLGSEEVWVEKGWRLAQLIVVPMFTVTKTSPVQDFSMPPESLEYSPRGTNGFGSTGI